MMRYMVENVVKCGSWCVKAINQTLCFLYKYLEGIDGYPSISSECHLLYWSSTPTNKSCWH